ncbi:MAG: hypothetical protein ACOC41_00905 [Chitinivibrionales bacterium]
MITRTNVITVLLCMLCLTISASASLSRSLMQQPEIKSAVYTSLQPPMASSTVHINRKNEALLQKLHEQAEQCGIAQPRQSPFGQEAHAASEAVNKLKRFEMPQVFDPSQTITLHTASRQAAYEVGDTVQIVWQASEKIPQVCIELSVDGAKSWLPLSRQAANGGQKLFNWVVPQMIKDKILISEDCRLRVRSADFLHKATMSENFTIKPQQSAAAN